MDYERAGRLFLSAIFIAIIAVSMASSISAAMNVPKKTEWPWGNKPEPFPWLDYLASLPHPDHVTLTLITRHENTIIQKTMEKFLSSEVAKKLGIDNIRTVFAGPELWETYIKSALDAGRPIDVAWGGGPTLFNYIDQLGYIEPLDNKTHPEYNAVLYEMSKIPPRIAGAPTWKIGSDGFVHWIGAAISSFGFTVNHKVLNQYGVPVPKKWKDLTDPVYAKYLPDVPLIGIADPTKSTSNTRMYEIILQAYGWDEGWKVLTLLAANSKIYDSSSGVRDAVIRAEIGAGITIDFYGYTAMHQNPDCEYIIPENESIVNADPIAILKNTRYPVQAAGFVAWVLSEYGGQQIWLDPDINRLPINARVFNTTVGQQRPDLLQAFKTATAAGIIQFNETLSGLTERAMQYYFKATLVNAHDELQSTWAAIAQAYLNGKINAYEYNYLIDELAKPFPFKDPLTGNQVTFTLDYAIKINEKLTQGSIYQALMSAWTDGATQRYQNTYNTLQKILSGELTITPPTTTTPTTTPPTTTTPTGGTTTTSQPTTTTQTTTPAGAGAGATMQYIIAAIVIIVIGGIIAWYYAKK